jgi:hypothetical protein
MRMKCPRCGALNADRLVICENCKAVLAGAVEDRREDSSSMSRSTETAASRQSASLASIASSVRGIFLLMLIGLLLSILSIIVTIIFLA